MRIRLIEKGKQFNTDDGSVNWSAAEMIDQSLDEATFGCSSDVDRTEVRLARLSTIVGRMLEKLPPHEWIGICGLEHVIAIAS